MEDTNPSNLPKTTEHVANPNSDKRQKTVNEKSIINEHNSLWASKLLKSIYYLCGLCVLSYLDRNHGPLSFLQTIWLSCIFTDFLLVSIQSVFSTIPLTVLRKSWAYMLTSMIRNVGYFIFFYDRLQRHNLDAWEIGLFFTIRPSI